ncbi:TPA: hypothetical protein DF272_06735 [Candidatus Falkowbacteria bacterium]|nr:hypothetical protein [Candidatus Falkowbacteria bacterium]
MVQAVTMYDCVKCGEHFTAEDKCQTHEKTCARDWDELQVMILECFKPGTLVWFRNTSSLPLHSLLVVSYEGKGAFVSDFRAYFLGWIKEIAFLHRMSGSCNTYTIDFQLEVVGFHRENQPLLTKIEIVQTATRFGDLRYYWSGWLQRQWVDANYDQLGLVAPAAINELGRLGLQLAEKK